MRLVTELDIAMPDRSDVCLGTLGLLYLQR